MAESVFAALLASRPGTKGLLPWTFEDAGTWLVAAERARGRHLTPPLFDEIARQSRLLPRSDARERHIERLARPGTAVVITGQQVGLFGGPLYTLYKAATAIARARFLEERTGMPCVPLFWLQTEDHDYIEIAQATLSSSGGPITLALPPESEPNRVSMSHRALPREVESLILSLENALVSLPHATEVVNLVRKNYVPGRPIAAAFAGLMAELWNDEGLVFLDPRVLPISKLAAPLFRRVLDEHATLTAALGERGALLRSIGCDEQVKCRTDASLLFFHPRGPEGPRYRLVRAGDGWETPEGPVSHSTLLDILDREPLRFSTSALLRPLVQDALLPTCAYIGGPAEVSYFAQLPPVYERLGIPMPLIAPRARLRLVDATTRSLLSRLGLEPSDTDAPRDALLQRCAARDKMLGTGHALRSRLLAPLERELAALAAGAPPELVDPIRRTQEACARAIGKLAEKVDRAAVEGDRVTLDRTDRVLLALRPGGVPQERAYGALSMAARIGASSLTRAVLAASAPLDPAVRDVVL